MNNEQLLQQHVKDPGHSAKSVQVAGYSMHLTYVALHEMTWCMVVWCNTERSQFTHVESHMSAVSLLESGEQYYIKAINNIKHFEMKRQKYTNEEKMKEKL